MEENDESSDYFDDIKHSEDTREVMKKFRLRLKAKNDRKNHQISKKIDHENNE